MMLLIFFLLIDPWILNRSVDDGIAPSLSVLKSVLGSNAFVIKLLKTSSWFLKSDLQKSMMPNIEKLRSVGISSSQIVTYVFCFPRFSCKNQILSSLLKGQRTWVWIESLRCFFLVLGWWVQ